MASPTVTYTFSNSTVADAAEVNTNFSDLINALTDGTSDHSISTLTLASTLTANGNITLGNASGDTLTVNATPTFAAATTFSSTIDVTGTASFDGDVNIGDGSGDTITVAGTTSFSADVAFDTDTLFVDVSEGRVGIGTTSPEELLHVDGNLTFSGTSGGRVLRNDTDQLVLLSGGNATNVGANLTLYGSTNADANVIRFRQSSTEVMRIDSGGLVGIGTDSPDSSFTTTIQDSGGGCLVLDRATGVTTGTVFRVRSNVGGTDTTHLNILADGDVENTNNSYSGLSDVRLKDNIIDASPKLEELNKVRVVNYTLKKDHDTKLLGVIAQELEDIFPGLVKENENGVKSVKYSVFTPMIIKAIQEQQAMIEKMQAEIDELKK